MIVDPSVVNCRIIIIGDTQVGKTSLVNRLIFDKFDEKQATTIGATHQFMKTDIEGSKMQLQIWDTAGEEKFRSLGPIYYRNSCGAIVVFDETNKSTFENLEDWIKAFTDIAKKNVVIAIAANKCDMKNKEVNYPDAKRWAELNGYIIEETSAKDGKGIGDLVSKMIPELYKVANSSKNGEKTYRNLDVGNDNTKKGCLC